MPECVICAAEIEVDSSTIKGELIECMECGTELEVVSVDPLELAEAPSEQEDWGQ